MKIFRNSCGPLAACLVLLAIFSCARSFGDEEFDALRAKYDVAEAEYEQAKAKAFQDDPVLKAAHELYEESDKWLDEVTPPKADLEAWFDKQEDTDKVKLRYDEMERYLSESFGLELAQDTLADPARKEMIISVLIAISDWRAKDDLSGNEFGEFLMAIRNEKDHVKIEQLYLKMMKDYSEKARKKYDELALEWQFPPLDIDKIKKVAISRSNRSISEEYIRLKTPDAVKEAEQRKNDVSRELSRRWPEWREKELLIEQANPK